MEPIRIPKLEPEEPQVAPAPETPIRHSIVGVIFGSVLLTISFVSSIALVTALAPKSTPAPSTQTAAVAEAAPDPFADVHLIAQAAYVGYLDGTELYSKNAETQRPLASITKVALVLAAAEVIDPESIITISREAVKRGGGGLTWGEEWRARDLIAYTLIVSSNTGAEALAEAADPLLHAKYPDSPAERTTVWRMNAIAIEHGLSQTYFLNPSGLDESTSQAGSYGSAKDMGALFAYAAKNHPTLFSATTRNAEEFAPRNFAGKVAQNTNEALPDISGLIMGKTGITDLAGGNLAVVFYASDDRPAVAVVLGSTFEGRFADIRALVRATQASAHAANGPK